MVCENGFVCNGWSWVVVSLIIFTIAEICIIWRHRHPRKDTEVIDSFGLFAGINLVILLFSFMGGAVVEVFWEGLQDWFKTLTSQQIQDGLIAALIVGLCLVGFLCLKYFIYKLFVEKY